MALQSKNYLPLVWRHYRSKKSLTLALITNLHLDSSTQDQSLMQAMNLVVANHKKRTEWLKLKEDIDLSFAGSQWQKLIYGANKQTINKKHLEACVVSFLAKELNIVAILLCMVLNSMLIFDKIYFLGRIVYLSSKNFVKKQYYLTILKDLRLFLKTS